jgi:hypothetical protein
VLATVAASRTESLAASGASVPDALTGGFSWLFLAAAGVALAAAVVAGFSRSGAASPR